MISQSRQATRDRTHDLDLAAQKLDDLERHGFCVVPDFFEIEEVDAARAEMELLFDRDLKMREEAGFSLADWNDGPTRWTSLTDVMHTVLFPTLHCPTLAQMVDRIITSPMGSTLIRGAVGDDYRLRADLCRRTTGRNDVGPDGGLPHAWHRDTPGEWTIGIYFDDLSEADHSATAALKGTHMLPFNPHWDFMVNRPCYRSLEAYLATEYRYMLDWFFRHNLFQGRVRDFLKKNGTGMFGKKSDWYFFFNDTWHGRQPNLFGQQLITVRFGGFATEFKFKDDIPAPQFPDHVPPTYAGRYADNQPVNTSTSSILQKMAASHKSVQRNIFGLARAEQKLAAALSRQLMTRWPRYNTDRYWATPK